MQKLNLTVIIAAIIIVIGILIGVYLIKGPSNEQTISTTGNAQITVAPDQAVVYLSIQTRDKSADKAKDQNAVISEKVLTALDKIGIEKSDIETQNYNINPEYDWNSGTQKIIGYAASNEIKITSKDFSNVGKIVDAAVDAGSLVSYINFELSNEKNNKYKTQVLATASQDAKTKAEAIASGLGKKLGSLVSVSAQDYNYMPYPLFRAEAGASVKEAVTDIQPKNLDVTATVSVSYRIK